MKVAIYCFDFQRDNVHRQPWRYIWEMAKFFVREGLEVELLTEGEKQTTDLIENVPVTTLPSSDFFNHLSAYLSTKKFQAYLEIQGFTSLFNPKRKKFRSSLSVPVIGVLTSPLYRLPFLFRLGVGEWVRNGKYYLHALITALTPQRTLGALLNHQNRVTIVTSQHMLEECLRLGVKREKLLLAPPGVDKSKLPPLRLSDSSGRKPFQEFLYLGSPLTLRGSEVSLNAFSRVVRKFPRAHLTMLCRTEYPSLNREVAYLQKLTRRMRLEEKVSIIPGVLSREQVGNYLQQADAILLPFKFVISDVPLAILEAMAAGKVVISTRVDGIPELLAEGRGIVVSPGNVTELAEAMSRLLTAPESAYALGKAARDYIETSHPEWDDSFRIVVQRIHEIIHQDEQVEYEYGTSNL
ncbi:MAG: glycosyltransferase [Calditrichaeota bacterium]|nr:MAG: glycosyltransferase [Calditrichota bacterium]